jgi:hypothetical protein
MVWGLEGRHSRCLLTPVTHDPTDPVRLTAPWFQWQLYSHGKSEAYFDLVHTRPQIPW